MTDGVETEPVVEAPVDDAAVAEGQATDQGSSPWDSWIKEQEIAEFAQAPVRAAFKHADGLATKKFQEHAEFRKQWEPYEPLGLNEYEPEFLQDALPIMRALQEGGDDARSIVEQMARQLGLIGEDDLEDEDVDGEYEDDDLEDGVDGELRERLERTEQFIQQQEQQRLAGEAQEYIDSAFGAIAKDLGRELADGERKRIEQIALGLANAGEENPIAAAWEHLKSYRGDVERELLEQKRQEPGRGEVGPSAPPARAPRRSGLSLEEQGNERLLEWTRANGIT